MRRTLRIGVGLALTVVLASAMPVAAAGNTYAGQSSSTQVSGIRGYIWATAAVLDDPVHLAQIHFINLCRTTSCTSWVQIGGYQGAITTISSPTAIHMYAENLDGCGNYGVRDLGAVPINPPNEFYAITDSGVNATIDCMSQRKWYLRYGSLNNPPSYIGYMSGALGIPIAETELHGGENMNTDYFGLSNTHAVDDTYGLRVLMSGTWKLWTAANVPGTGPINDAPPYFVQKKAWTAFQTHD